MDELLRALRRRYHYNTQDSTAAAEYIAALERILTGDTTPSLLNNVLMYLLIGHLDEDGVDASTNLATLRLIELVRGDKAANEYLRTVSVIENRWFFDLDDIPGTGRNISFQEIIDTLKLECASRICECANDPESPDRIDTRVWNPCSIRNCLCPSSHLTRSHYTGPIFQQIPNLPICEHHCWFIDIFGPQQVEWKA